MNEVLRPFVIGLAAWTAALVAFALGLPLLGIEPSLGLLASSFGIIVGLLGLWWANRQRRPRQE